MISDDILLRGLASLYSMSGLRSQLAQQLATRITLDNCCSLLTAADAYGCEELKRTTSEKLFSNFASVSKTTAFCELSIELIEDVLGSDDILDCDESLVFEAAVRWLGHTSCDGGDRDAFGVRVLSLVRFPLIDSCLLSDVIKVHRLMQGHERAGLLLEAFEHHALKAAGRAGLKSPRTVARKQSCVFHRSTLLNGHTDAVSCLLSLGDWLVSGSWDNNIKVWSADNWVCVRTLSDHSGAIRALCACHEKLVSCSDDGVVKVWTPGSWTCVRSIESAHEGAVNALTQCRGRLASAGDDGAIKLWGVASWTCEVSVHHTASPGDGGGAEGTPVGVMCLEMIGEDRLASGGDDCVVRIWNTADWSCECLLSPHEGEIWALLHTADGALVSSSVNGCIRVWRNKSSGGDPSGWECEHEAHADGSIYALCNLDGRIVSAGGGNTIAVWGAELDWKLEKELLEVGTSDEGLAEGVWSLEVCRGRLVSGLMDGTIRVWT